MCIIKIISALPGYLDPVILEPDFNRAHEIFEELADQYGKLFTVQFANQPLVVVADVKPINFILLKKPVLFDPYRKKNQNFELIKVDGIEAANDHAWKQQREIMSSVESSCLARYFENIKAVTGDLKSHWIAYGENRSENNLEAEIFDFSISVFKSKPSHAFCTHEKRMQR